MIGRVKSFVPTKVKTFIKRNILGYKNRRKSIIKECDSILYHLHRGNFIEDKMIDCGAFEPHLQMLFKNIIQEKWTVLDIGANVGIHSLLFSRLVGPQGKVFCFEPVNYNLQRLNLNCYLNGGENLTLVPCAVGEKNEMGVIHEVDIGSYDLGNSSMVLNEYLSSLPSNCMSRKTVPTICLDDFCGKYNLQPNFIKMDIEGFEYYAMKGAINTLKAHRPILVLEYSTPRINYIGLDNSSFEEILHPLYDCYEICPQNDTEDYVSLANFDFKRNMTAYLLCIPKLNNQRKFSNHNENASLQEFAMERS